MYFLCCSMYCLFCDVLCIVCVYMCAVLLPPGGYPIAVKYSLSYHIISHQILALITFDIFLIYYTYNIFSIYYIYVYIFTIWLIHVCPSFNRKYTYFIHTKILITAEFNKDYEFHKRNPLSCKSFYATYVHIKRDTRWRG